MRQRGFALFDVLLAVVLMAIAAAGSYTLVKSFRANSSTQQFIRYSTTITQSFIPFLNGADITAVLNNNQLSTSFLKSIGIPDEDQGCSNGFCNVDSGMYLDDKKSQMAFGVQTNADQTLANYFIIAVRATGVQVNQVLQSASSLFSVYCPVEGGSLSGQSKCALVSKDTASTQSYNLYLVFPKSGDTPPTSSFTPPE